MENHHFSWENPLFLWPFSIAMLVYQRVSIVHIMLLVGGLNHLEKYENFVRLDHPSDDKGNIKFHGSSHHQADYHCIRVAYHQQCDFSFPKKSTPGP